MVTKGIILAGGKGTRLYPNTSAICKQLLPVYDKPLIYYPLSCLMLSNIRDIMLITTPRDLGRFQDLLGDGSQWGIRLSYAVQAEPNGLPEALVIARDFIAGQPCCLVLGDNILFGEGLSQVMTECSRDLSGAHIFCYRVNDPSQFGVVRFDEHGAPVEIVEKPTTPVSNHAIIGLYYFDGRAADYAATLKPSRRGETEITDLINIYLSQGQLSSRLLGRGFAWLDAGTPESLHEAASFVRALEKRQGLRIACPEEVALEMGFIDAAKLKALAETCPSKDYGNYLLSLLGP
jgi:glucose-1-phosphate thymidylyltransferase